MYFLLLVGNFTQCVLQTERFMLRNMVMKKAATTRIQIIPELLCCLNAQNVFIEKYI